MESCYKYFRCAVKHKIFSYKVENLKVDIEFLDNVSLSNGEKVDEKFCGIIV